MPVFSELAAVEENHSGTVFRSTGKWVDVQTKDGRRVECRLRGKFRMEGLRTTNPVAVGDHVTWTEEEDGTGVITVIEPRRNRIIRRSVNLSHEAHVVAANVDRAWLVVTLVEPATSSGFVDRFLVTAEAYGVPTTLLFNKVDVLLQLGEEAEDLLASWMTMYSEAGYECLPISAKEGIGLDEVRARMKGGIHLVSGHSGVGKSTLLNALIPGVDQKTAEVSDVHERAVTPPRLQRCFHCLKRMADSSSTRRASKDLVWCTSKRKPCTIISQKCSGSCPIASFTIVVTWMSRVAQWFVR